MWKFFKIHVSGFCAFQFILNFVFHCAKQSSGLSVFLYYLRTKFCFKQKEISVLSLQDSSVIPSPSLLLSSEFEGSSQCLDWEHMLRFKEDSGVVPEDGTEEMLAENSERELFKDWPGCLKK